jgi:tetratricopeptide (TPR) repeat protein
MSSFSATSRRACIAALAVLIVASALAAYFLWQRSRALPGPGSERYEKYDDAFQRGVAALDADEPKVAEPSLTEAIDLISDEPAAWANRGLLYLRRNQLDKAARDLEKADRLAPNNPGIAQMLGLLEQSKGNFGAAADYFRRAVEGNPHDVQATYQLAKIVDQERKAGSDAEYLRLMDQILAVQPDNLHVLLDKLNRAVRLSDRAAVDKTFARLEQLCTSWKEESREALAQCKGDLAPKLGPDAAVETLLLTNKIRSEPAYGRGLSEVDPAKLPGTPLYSYVRLAPVPQETAVPDFEMAFSPGSMHALEGRWDAAVPVWLTGEGNPVIFAATTKELRRSDAPTVLASIPVSPLGLIPLDWNNDFRMDLLVVGPEGLRLYEQQKDSTFQDVSSKLGLPAEVLKGDYFAAWAQDIDADGDLDIVLAPRSGPPLLLLHQPNGTFAAKPIFDGVTDVRAFAWLDLDGDGAPDVALLDARGKLHIFANERSGRFVPWPVKPPSDRFLALTVIDANDDGVLDLVALRDDGALLRISDRDKRQGLDVAQLASWSDMARKAEPGTRRLFAADFDNNGAVDILASGPEHSQLWLGLGKGEYQPSEAALVPGIIAVADLDGTGQLDLLALSSDGQLQRLRSIGTKKYHWQALRLQARTKENMQERDQWMNSFAIGSEVEVRAGTYVVKQPVTTPVTHFGLGKRARPTVFRAQWTSGRVNSYWDTPVDQVAAAVQIGHVSCPFLFTWNGERFEFVTDFMWSSPLGVPGSDTGQDSFALQTRDWTKIRGDQLVPKDGVYEIRTLANLWETHFYDQLSLEVVDHPADTELFVDERASLTPAQLAFHLVEKPRPVARAWDHHGNDVTAIVSAIDGVYLDRAGRGPFAGITNDHWVEVDLSDDAPKEGPVWLIARGWVLPVSSSTYFALGQGPHEEPREPVLEVPDGRGGWKVARDNIGYPAGKNKTILIPLNDGPQVIRRFRIRTNMEIYWDALFYARGRDDAPKRQQLLSPQYADLHFRGVLDMTRADSSSPELPHYDRIASQGQPWRNLIGFHTRYGDVRELLEKSDDRYVIATAGDEMTLRFAVPPGPLPGWKRDFIWKCDGWTKDGDLNTRFGKTVLPLPAHDLKNYDTPPGRLEDDQVYRRHSKDWEIYHTRYVRPDIFERGLRGPSGINPEARRGEATRTEP